MSTVDDEIRALLEANRRPEAFDLLLGYYRDKVFRLAYSISGDRSISEEAAQDAFVRIWRALPNFRGESALSTWVYAIARNTCLTSLKRAGDRKTVSLEEPAVRAAAEAIAATTQGSSGEYDLPNLLSQLPEKYRQVLTLFYMEEKSYEDVAAMLSLPMGTLKTYIHRAKKELATALTRTRMEKGAR